MIQILPITALLLCAAESNFRFEGSSFMIGTLVARLMSTTALQKHVCVLPWLECLKSEAELQT